MSPMTHDYLKVLLVFLGKGELRGSRWSFSLGKEDLALVPPGCEHWIVDHRPLSLYVLCFRLEDYADGCRAVIGESGRPRILPDAGNRLLEITRRLLHEQMAVRAAGNLMARGLGWEILALLARIPAAKSSYPCKKEDLTGSRARVATAAAELKHRFYEPVRLEEEARRAGLGRRRFSDLFREVNGTTWWEALSLARMAHAERLLCETERSVAAIAFECGYGDLSGFYRAWGARHESNPQAWRAATSPKAKSTLMG